MTDKKVVHYKEGNAVSDIIVGRSAIVFPVDHYNSESVSNKKYVVTSTVLRVDEESGEFETLNTIYRPLKQTEIQ
jgi:hypothetical protein